METGRLVMYYIQVSNAQLVLHTIIVCATLIIGKIDVMLTTYLVQVQLRTEVLRTPSSIRLGFELMSSRSWQYIPCHWDSCSNQSAISDI